MHRALFVLALLLVPGASAIDLDVVGPSSYSAAPGDLVTLQFRATPECPTGDGTDSDYEDVTFSLTLPPNMLGPVDDDLLLRIEETNCSSATRPSKTLEFQVQATNDMPAFVTKTITLRARGDDGTTDTAQVQFTPLFHGLLEAKSFTPSVQIRTETQADVAFRVTNVGNADVILSPQLVATSGVTLLDGAETATIARGQSHTFAATLKVPDGDHRIKWVVDGHMAGRPDQKVDTVEVPMFVQNVETVTESGAIWFLIGVPLLLVAAIAAVVVVAIRRRNA